MKSAPESKRMKDDPTIAFAEAGIRADEVKFQGKALVFLYGLEAKGLLKSRWENHGNSSVRVFYPKALEAPPAAERTALARIQERLLDQDHFSEVCDKGKLVYHKEFVDRIIKEEIEAPKSDNAPAIGKEEAIQAPAKPMTPSTTDSETTAQAIWENDDFQDGLEMIRGGLKEEQFTAYTTILQAIKAEIDASEGTKSE